MARSVTVIPARSQKVRTGHKAVQEKKIRVAAYCRVSTDQEDQLHSFEAQLLTGHMLHREMQVQMQR